MRLSLYILTIVYKASISAFCFVLFILFWFFSFPCEWQQQNLLICRFREGNKRTSWIRDPRWQNGVAIASEKIDDLIWSYIHKYSDIYCKTLWCNQQYAVYRYSYKFEFLALCSLRRLMRTLTSSDILMSHSSRWYYIHHPHVYKVYKLKLLKRIDIVK
jgi:hypothetical protein